jgi:hypothetical protein
LIEQVPFIEMEGAAQNLDEETSPATPLEVRPIEALQTYFKLSLFNKYNITSADSHSPDSVYSLALGLSALSSLTAALR